MSEDTTATTRVLIVDDQQLLVSSFALLLSHTPGITVAGTASNGRDAVALLARVPDVSLVLMDLQMPVMDGVTTIRTLRTDPSLATLPVLVLTTFDDDALVLGALRAGANGYLLKDAEPDILIRAVRTVAAGGAWLDPAITGSVLRALEPLETHRPQQLVAPCDPSVPPAARAPSPGRDTRPQNAALAKPLTPREAQVLELVCQGLSNAGIGQRLFVAESTVKTYIRELLGKTGCSNRVELIVHAYRHGLAEPG